MVRVPARAATTSSNDYAGIPAAYFLRRLWIARHDLFGRELHFGTWLFINPSTISGVFLIFLSFSVGESYRILCDRSPIIDQVRRQSSVTCIAGSTIRFESIGIDIFFIQIKSRLIYDGFRQQPIHYQQCHHCNTVMSIPISIHIFISIHVPSAVNAVVVPICCHYCRCWRRLYCRCCCSWCYSWHCCLKFIPNLIHFAFSSCFIVLINKYAIHANHLDGGLFRFFYCFLFADLSEDCSCNTRVVWDSQGIWRMIHFPDELGLIMGLVEFQLFYECGM